MKVPPYITYGFNVCSVWHSELDAVAQGAV